MENNPGLDGDMKAFYAEEVVLSILLSTIVQKERYLSVALLDEKSFSG